MKIIIDAPRYYRAILKYLDKTFEGGYISDKKNSTFFLNSDKKVLAVYHKKYDTIYINTNELWFKFERVFSLDYQNLANIFKKWFKLTAFGKCMLLFEYFLYLNYGHILINSLKAS